ncbi:hypothetical protein WN943_022254 [Citrus x changshan-huyou]
MDETVDQISDLPPSIIHHIMTYLSAKEVTRTSILSTSWNQFQNSFPILDFDLMNFIVRIEIVNIKLLRGPRKGEISRNAPPLLNVVECAHLKKLLLSEFPLNDRELHHLISKCPLLEDLSISHCHSLGRIMISSNKLEHLLISSCYGLNALDVDAPRLLSFIFDLNPIPIISTNALCPWNVTLDCDSNLDCDWFLSLKEFLGASSQIERLCIDFSSVEVVFNLDELRRCYPSLPLQVETMDLCWLFDRLQNRNTNCCNDLHIKCWRHYLKDVKVEQFEPIRGCEINVDELMDRGFMIPKGELWLRLDWCFPVLELNIINETVRMDQTLELPTFIIHQIMSYLSAKEVARTRILSKRWNQLNAHSLSLILIN